MKSLVFCALFVLVASAQAAEISVQATVSGEALEIQAAAELPVSLGRAWEVLTDYDRFAEFVPDLHLSRVIRREGHNAVIEQKGAARFLFFSYPIEVRIAVTEYPRARIESIAVAGNFRELRGTYFLEARDGGVLLRYAGRLIPDFDVPAFFRNYLLRSNVEDTFRALVEEIERGQRPVTSDQ